MTFYPNYKLDFPNYAGTLNAAGMNFGTGFDMNFGLNFNTGFSPNFSSFNSFGNFGGGGNFGSFGNFGNFGGFGGFGGIGSGFDTFASASTKKEETYDEYQKRKAKEKERKTSEYKKLQDEIKQYEEALKPTKEFIAKAETAVENEETGALVVKESKEDFKKLGFWKKTGRFLLNAGAAALDCGMNILGIKEFGLIPPKLKIDWKQLGKTALSVAAIAAATCIPVVGPFVLPVLTCAGLAIGSGKLVTGIVKAATTDNPEEFDNAAKGAGEGGLIAALSAVGIKKAGGFKAMFSNAQKAAAVDSRAISMYGNGIKGCIKTYGAKFNRSFINPVRHRVSPKYQNSKFKSRYKIVKNELTKRIQDIDTELSTATDQSKIALLNQEKGILNAQINQLDMTVKQSEWAGMSKNSSLEQGLNEVTANRKSMRWGKNISIKDASGNPIELKANRENMQTLENLEKSMTEMNSKVQELVNLRKSSMRAMSHAKGYATEVSQYTEKTSKLGRQWAANKSCIFTEKWQNRKLIGKILSPLKTVFWDIPCKPFVAYHKMASTGYASEYNFEKVFIASEEPSMILELFGALGAKIPFMGGETPLLVAGEDGQQQMLTKEGLDAYKSEVKKAETKIAELKKKQRELYA